VSRRKVQSISGGAPPDDVIDEMDLEIVADLQAEEWKVQQRLQHAVNALETRILHGARVVAKSRKWDPELRMVRTVRKSAGSAGPPDGERRVGRG
jgi:hypothetical protein